VIIVKRKTTHYLQTLIEYVQSKQWHVAYKVSICVNGSAVWVYTLAVTN